MSSVGQTICFDWKSACMNICVIRWTDITCVCYYDGGRIILYMGQLIKYRISRVGDKSFKGRPILYGDYKIVAERTTDGSSFTVTTCRERAHMNVDDTNTETGALYTYDEYTFVLSCDKEGFDKFREWIEICDKESIKCFSIRRSPHDIYAEYSHHCE